MEGRGRGKGWVGRGGGEGSGNDTCTQQAGLVACQQPAYATNE